MNPSRSKNPIPSSDPYSNLRELASLRIVSGRVKIAATELMLVHCRTHLPLASDNSVPLIVTVNNGYPLPPPSRFSISVHGSVDILPDEGMPQAIEVVGKTEQQGLANLYR